MRVCSGALAGTVVLVALGLANTTAQGQERIGQITATLDGEAVEWITYAAGDSSDEYNTVVRDLGGMSDVSVMGFLPGRIAMREALQITFMVMPGADGAMDQEIYYLPETMSRMWASIEGEDPITIQQFDTSAPMGEVSGRISGRLCFKDGMFAEPDPAQCKQIEGTFSTRLPRGEF